MSRAVGSDGLPALRSVIETYGLSAKRNLGQNFILDLNLTAKIASLAGALDNRVVLEIGPGPGGLTRALLAAGARHVVAIERDERCLPALADIAAHWPGRLSVHAADALETDGNALVEAARSHAGENVLIIANLPYSIATKLLVQWLESEPWPPWFDGMVLMFQKEVAERIVATPASKPYGRLAVISQWRCACNIAMTLGPDAFTPPPKVASAVVHFKPRASTKPACDVIKLGQVSRTLFGQRRKMLRATMKPLFRDPESVLTRLGIDPTARAETLTVDEIATIALEMDRSK